MQAADGEEALAAAKEHLARPDPARRHDAEDRRHRGLPAAQGRRRRCRSCRSSWCTAKADTKDVVAGLDAGADEYLTKPIDQMALVARVKSVLRLKELHDQVQPSHDLATGTTSSSASPSSSARSSA